MFKVVALSHASGPEGGVGGRGDGREVRGAFERGTFEGGVEGELRRGCSEAIHVGKAVGRRG